VASSLLLEFLWRFAYSGVMDRAARVRAELTHQIELARAVEAAGPPCRDCKHSTLTGSCGNPAYYSQSFEPSTGKYRIDCATPQSIARAEDGLCGPEGLLWEPQSKVSAIINGVSGYMDAHPWFAVFGFFGLWGLLETFF
jgi:hypothetical protein